MKTKSINNLKNENKAAATIIDAGINMPYTAPDICGDNFIVTDDKSKPFSKNNFNEHFSFLLIELS